MKTLLFVFIPVCSLLAQTTEESTQGSHKAYGVFNMAISASWFNHRLGPVGDGMRDESEKSARATMQFGFGATVPITPALRAHAELNFAGRGGTFTLENSGYIIVGSGQNVNNNYTHRLNYLEIPVMAQLKLFKEHDDTGWLGIGAAYGMNLSSYFVAKEFDEKAERYDFDYAEPRMLSIVADLLIEIGNSGTGMMVRYSQSLGDVYAVDQVDGNNMKGKTCTLSLGMYFKL